VRASSSWSGEYAELGVMTNFSFLEGASHPGEQMFQAKSLGLSAIGVADRNTLAGMVRALMGAEDHNIPLVVGCRLGFLDGAELIVFPRDRAAYGRLCRLLTLGKSEILDEPVASRDDAPASNVVDFPGGEARPGAEDAAPDADPVDRITKGETRLTFDRAVAFGEGMIALAVAPIVPDAAFEACLKDWRERWPDALYLAAQPLWRGGDRARLNRLAAMAERTGAPLIATNAVLYHHPDRRPLQDVLTCIREGTTIDAAGVRLQANAERHLRDPAAMARLFRGHEAALHRTMEVVRACKFSLRELSYDYPDEPVPPGWSPQGWLIRLTCRGARGKWPDGVPTKVVETIRKELRLVRERKYAPYFLTVHDVVAWAREPERNILCQGRGSAANSVICFCLGVTNVDPTSQDMLIERFISSERSEPPDIDVDFEHERRELVMQYVYDRYGRDRAGIVATIIHYRPRSAIRDVGKALGLTEDVTARMADTVWGSYGDAVKDDHVDRTGLSRDDARMEMALQLTAELIKFPRHLSQHVGGFVLSQGPLVEIVPIGNAAMKDRTFIEWDKDDIDHLKLMKVDVLALGMLTAMKRAFAMIEDSYDRSLALDTIPKEAPGVYDMLCKADSLGVFQVESRAQMAMLPRLQPRVFYDLVVQVAIVRPGPIQGGMVHPYLKRRTERRAIEAGDRSMISRCRALQAATRTSSGTCCARRSAFRCFRNRR
jgi:error-prone DNA polymerase